MFMLTEQFQTRRLDPEAPAPIAGLSVSIVMLVLVGGMVIWYVASLVRWMRTDRAVAGIVKATRETAGAIERHRRRTCRHLGPVISQRSTSTPSSRRAVERMPWPTSRDRSGVP